MSAGGEPPEPPVGVEVVGQDRPGSYLVRVGGRDQSHVDLHDPTRLVFDYVRRMADVVDAIAAPGTPVRVVHVGGAGLTLPRYVAATRPTSAQIVLEPDEALTERVRAELPLPRRSGIKVRPVGGVDGVAALRDASADLLLLDAFVEGRVPEELLTVEALADVRRVLGDGVVVLNLVDRPPFAATRRVVAGVQASFTELAVGGESATWNGRREGNLVLVASHRPLPAGAPRPGRDYRVVRGPQVRDTLGGGAALRRRFDA